MDTIYSKFVATAEKFKSRPALKFKYHGAYVSVSFGELRRRVDSLAVGLQLTGITHGTHVAILSENRTEWVRVDLALAALGAISVPIHTTVSPNIIEHILNDSQAETLIVSTQELFNKVMLIAHNLTFLNRVIYFHLDSIQHFSKFELLSLEEVMKRGNGTSFKPAAVFPHDVASIVYTSGTLALPKGVMLTHHNFLFDAEASVTAVPVNEYDVLLSFLPLSHVLERTAGYYAPLLCRGCCIAYAESIQTLKQNLKEVRPTVVVAVPRVFEKIHTQIWEHVKIGSRLTYKLFVLALKQEPGTVGHWLANHFIFRKIRANFGGRLRLSISGGATLNHKLARFFSRIGITIVDGFGLTETSPVITCNRPGNIKFGTVGQQLAGVEIMIAADKELLTRGPHVMKGYYNNDALTNEVIDSEGWFHTGDLGFITREGFLVVIGRKKEMISLSNGKIAWPEQLEVILDNDRFILQSMIYGDKKSYLSALVVPDWTEVMRELDRLGIKSREPDVLIKDEKLRAVFQQRLDKINEQLAEWEKIRKFVLLPHEFAATKDEVTPTQKLRRMVIAEHHQKELNALY